VKDSSDDSGMEVSNGDSVTSDDTPDSDTGKHTVNNIQENVNNGSNTVVQSEKIPRLFKFSLVNSYGTAELDYKITDDGKPIKLNGK